MTKLISFKKLKVPDNAIYRYRKNARDYFDSLDSPLVFNELDKNQQKILVEWCKGFDKIQSFTTNASSYGLKHLFEKSNGGFYVANGAFKGAMIIAGFDVKDTSVLNWQFNISKLSYRTMYKKIYD